MFKYSITKKQVYALVLESKKITYKPVSYTHLRAHET